MLKVTESNKKYFDEMHNEVVDMGIFVENKIYHLADTSLSYRQVNALTDENMIEENRKNTNEWRTFSTKDIVYLELIHELRKYGLKNKHLIDLKNCFYKGGRINDSFIAIALSALGVPIYLLLTSDHEAVFTDIENLEILNATSFLVVNLSSIVLPMFEKNVKPKGFIDYPFDEKELAIIRLIRNQDFKKISINTKGGEPILINCESENKCRMTMKELLGLVNSKDYTDIKLTKRDGKVVNLTISDVIKM